MSSTGGNAGGRSLQLVRLTVVGASGTGKTSLVSAFVNNSCPTVHAETTEPALYYRTVQVLPGKSDAGHQSAAGGAATLASKVTLNALVEIEDTPPSGNADLPSSPQGGQSGGLSQTLTGGLSRPLGTPSRSGTPSRALSQQRDLERYISCKRKQDMRWSSAPFQGIPAPKAKEYDPIGQGRMGFLVVFDASDATGESLLQAKDLIDRINRQELTQDVRPIIYVVANKADKLVMSTDAPAVCTIAKEYASDRKLRYEELSALDLKKVRGIFRNLVSDIRDKPSLWKSPDPSSGGPKKSAVSNNRSSIAAQKGVASDTSSFSEAMGNNCRMQ